MLTNIQQKKIEKNANLMRQDIIKMLEKAGSGHSAGPLGMADVFASLYFNALNHNPKKPDWALRDRVVLSCGHICPVHYAALARAGYFPVEELSTLRRLGSRLQGHPHYGALPGIENTSGPLGQGISQAVGMALAAKMDGKKHFVYNIGSDGELNEGQVWEAYMSGAKYELYNLISIIDRNNIQIDGYTEDVMPFEPLVDKFEAFGWHVQEVNGHDVSEIVASIEKAKVVYDKPSVIIALTIPGKGVSFMERKYEWHGKAPTKEEAKVALKELRI